MDPELHQSPAHAAQVLHPPVQPYDQDWLNVDDGHQIYWEQSGHPGAPVALFLNGGPGVGCTPQDRRWFHPQQWRTVLVDQRGCGRSLSERGPLVANTTAHLVADLEVLRRHLGIKQWMLFGGSWGSTLALAYAQAHPQRVLGLVLRGVFLGTRAQSRWLYGDEGAAPGAALRHPQAWQRLCKAVGRAPGQPLLDAAHARLRANDGTAREAAQAWWQWENELMGAETASPANTNAIPAATALPATATATATPTAAAAATATTTPAEFASTARPPPGLQADPAQALQAARVGVHYARAGWFLQQDQLLAQAQRLAGVPGIIVQGQHDLITPPAAARALHRAWPGSQLVELPNAGHASTHPAVAAALIMATESLATRTLAQTALALSDQETSHV
jgi:proline iminopeptidase